MIIVIMGVCGSGKSAVGDTLSKRLNCAFAEADQYHPDANKEKMGNGIPLTDEDRWPWLLQLHDIVYSLHEAGAMGVVTCSALRKIYRQVIMRGGIVLGQSASNSSHPVHNITDDQSLGASGGGSPNDCEVNANTNGCAKDVVFVYLKADEEVLRDRIQARSGHFMSASLLTSQLDALEEPGADEQSITVNTNNRSLEDVLHELEERLGRDFNLCPDR